MDHIVDYAEALSLVSSFFFFNDTATTEIYTLSLHDALPISPTVPTDGPLVDEASCAARCSTYSSNSATAAAASLRRPMRSEEHTSELQSQSNLVCRLLLEKKKKDAHNPLPSCHLKKI